MVISRAFVAALCLFSILIRSPVVSADHLSPERVVGGKYLVILLLNQEGGEMRLRFLFRDLKTGRNENLPVSYRFVLWDENGRHQFFESPLLYNTDSKDGFLYAFPGGGLYTVSLSFEPAEEPGNTYRPDPWSIWVPGMYRHWYERYPIGLSELGGLGLLGVGIAVFFASVARNKKAGKPHEMDILKWFGLS